MDSDTAAATAVDANCASGPTVGSAPVEPYCMLTAGAGYTARFGRLPLTVIGMPRLFVRGGPASPSSAAVPLAPRRPERDDFP